MAALGQTIAVVDNSGKVVSTSKHLINVFKEAKAAYRERKAEIVAGRQYELEEKKAHRALQRLTLEDDVSSKTSRDSSRSKRSHRRPSSHRYYSDSVASSANHRTHSPPLSPLELRQACASLPTSPRTLTRRHTDVDGVPKSPSITRSQTSPCNIDMDLAYGDIPPPLEVTRVDEEVELRGLVHKVKMMLEEAECLQYSATSIISILQKDPDAMAAVALTLAEISNLASKLAPGALMALKGSSPAVFALLASPQFLIAAGVGVGITVVALGGYKIIKKIKAKSVEEDPGMDEMLEIGGDVSRIDNWRRGIAEAHVESAGTSVDGEFITPQAAALSRLNLTEDVPLTPRHRSSRRSSSEKQSSKGSKSSREKHSSRPKTKEDKDGKKREKKEKKPSPLRLMFQQQSIGVKAISLAVMTHFLGISYQGTKTSGSGSACVDELPQSSTSLMNSPDLTDEDNENESSNDRYVPTDRAASRRGIGFRQKEAVEQGKKPGATDILQGELRNQYYAGSEKSHRSESLQAGHLERGEKEKVLKLSPAQIHELTSSPESLPRVAPAHNEQTTVILDGPVSDNTLDKERLTSSDGASPTEEYQISVSNGSETPFRGGQTWDFVDKRRKSTFGSGIRDAPLIPSGRKSSQDGPRSSSFRKDSSMDMLSAQDPLSPSRKNSKSAPKPLNLDGSMLEAENTVSEEPLPSPMPRTIPIPPYSLPTYLQLELSSHRPSPLYIHHSPTNDFPYESSRVKLERLQNFLRVPFQLEGVLWFGFFACLDAWLSSFTILPLRFLKALGMLSQSVIRNVAAELKFIGISLYSGPGRVWRRRRASSATSPVRPSFSSGDPPTPKEPNPQDPSPKSPHFSFLAESDNASSDHTRSEPRRRNRRVTNRKHRRAKSTPSALGPDHKADMVKGFLILCSCLILMQFDASRMYHGIRGQAAIKLYVIYNVLEVCDRLFSAIGQDILECLFSKEALERKPDGRSKVMRPFWLFILALAYNLVHSTALFYQVITLNVAVNSYSNALLTLLMSNQFVEIKSTVFKKFEKENLFQLTCADVVERFQLWLMLTIIALRNLIETGGLSLSSSTASDGVIPPPPLSKTSSIYPKSFTIFPTWAGLLFQPFILVLGSEMLVDSLKHCYITKFNNTKPAIYGRFHDVLAKDYYTNAFADQNLTRRLGLPVIPLSCLFIRALVQTYHMFLATHLPPPIASTATSLSVDSTTTGPATTAAIQHIDNMFRRALGRSTLGAASSPPISFIHPTTWLRYQTHWSADDFIALVTMLTFFLILFLCLLILKLLLGMVLLSYSRSRYRGMKERENESLTAEGRRVGGWGVVEVDEDKRRWIYQDDKEGGRRAREREERGKGGGTGGGEGGFGRVRRYSMVAKRIW
ncbi:MAG: hypothetical protein Q9170_001833 [Blastenia crenularia]